MDISSSIPPDTLMYASGGGVASRFVIRIISGLPISPA